jgi:ACR3 family arsenite efflux pump ArsB
MIILTVVAAIFAGGLYSSLVKPLTSYMLYLIAVMIWAMSVTIRFSDLSLAFRKGKLIGCGLVTNFVFLPLLCYILAISFLSQSPRYAAGFVLMGTVPCAGMNVVWTGLLKGDVSLALLLGALTMILGIVTIPSLTGILAGAYVPVDIIGMLRTVAVALLIPIILGMITRSLIEKRAPYKMRSILAVFPPIAAVIAMFLMFIMISINVSSIPVTIENLVALIVPSLLLFPIAFGGIRLFCDKLLKCDEEEVVAVVYSSGMKHLPLAMGIAFVSLGQQAALPIAVAAVFQTLNASIFYRIFQRRVV